MATNPEATVKAHGEPAGKRPSKRAKKRLQVLFGIGAPGATGFTTNFSDTGLFVQTTIVMTPGTALRLEIHAGETFPLQGRVVWAKKPRGNHSQTGGSGMGLQVVDPSAAWVEFCKQDSA